MGYLLFFGCLFIAFGPAFATFVLVLIKNPQLVIISIGSSFFWLCSLLIASIWWYIIPPLRYSFFWVIPWTIFFQEALRIVFYKLYSKGEIGLVNSTKTSHLTSHPDHLKTALAFGVGSGVTDSLITYISILWESTGPGTYMSPSCPSISLFLLSSIYSLFFVLFHIFWAILSFDSWRKRDWKKLGAVAGTHLVASLLTLLNLPGGNCFASLFLLFGLLVGVGIWTFLTILKHSTLVRTLLITPDDE
jgi:anterior pharynx defective protein 1